MARKPWEPFDRKETMPEDEQRRELLEHTTKIVGAHVANNPIAAAELPGVIATVHHLMGIRPNQS